MGSQKKKKQKQKKKNTHTHTQKNKKTDALDTSVSQTVDWLQWQTVIQTWLFANDSTASCQREIIHVHVPVSQSIDWSLTVTVHGMKGYLATKPSVRILLNPNGGSDSATAPVVTRRMYHFSRLECKLQTYPVCTSSTDTCNCYFIPQPSTTLNHKHNL